MRTDGGGDRYQTHVKWLRDSHFLRDLERDNIDSDVIDEELDTLKTDDSPLTGRERVIKFLRSHPVQTFLCAIVLVDASIVIAQILLDINSVKDQLVQRDDDLTKLVEFLRRTTNSDSQLHDYDGNDVTGIVRVIHDSRRSTNAPKTRPDFDVTNCTRPSCLQEHVASVGYAEGGRKMSSSSNLTDDHSTAYDDDVNRNDDNSNLLPSVSRDRDNESGTTAVDSTDYGQLAAPRVDIFRQVAHSLHYVSIVILGVLLLEDVVRIIALGKYICRHKIEIFDALVIATSFAVDIVFVGGITGDHGQKAAAALFVLLVWRVARVVDGASALGEILALNITKRKSRPMKGSCLTARIIVTIKQRQEFRIRLQRRARRKAEKKVDAAEAERHQTMRELQALQDLCIRAGIKPENIEAVCSNGKSPKRLTRMLQAFSSVARFSFGMTLPYSRPSSACSSRRQSRIVRHPSDGFLTGRRVSYGPDSSDRRGGRTMTASDTEAGASAGGLRSDDDAASFGDEVRESSAVSRQIRGQHRHRTAYVISPSSVRKRSNSDSTTYFLHHSSSGLMSDVVRDAGFVYRGRSGLTPVMRHRPGYRRVVLDRIAGRIVVRDSPESSSSVDSIGVNVVWNDCPDFEVRHGSGSGGSSSIRGGRRRRDIGDDRRFSNWSSDGEPSGACRQNTSAGRRESSVGATTARGQDERHEDSTEGVAAEAHRVVCV